jgi:hypothetical protein
MSNMTPEEERQQLMEAAKQEPRILDEKDVTLADIAKLAGIKEYSEPAVSKEAEQLIESVTKEESIITKAINESDADDSISTAITKTVNEESKRLDKIAELEAQLAELKAEQKEEQTYDTKSFRDVISKDIAEYIKNADDSALVELYNTISDNEAVYNEESSSILIKTPETKEIIADAEKAIEDEQEQIQEKEDDKFTDKQIKMAFGILNDPKYKGGNYDGAVEVINKIAPGLADHPSVANALKRANEDTNEAGGYEGQSEFRAHKIRLSGDYDPENPVSDQDAEEVKQTIMKNSGEQEGRAIVVDVEPSEENFDSVIVHTMRDKEDILKYLGDMVEEEVKYTDELSEGKAITEAEFEKLAEKEDACYHKVKSRYKVWPSAYASGALVQCRKVGAANWGNKSKK